MSNIQVMIDLETMSTRSNAAICSIGAVKFSVEDGILDKFYKTIDARSAKEYGLHFSKDTVEWWRQQNTEALRALTIDCVELDEALDKFTEWYGEKGIPTWGNGAGFDNVIMENAYFAIGKVRPWKYWHDRCYRTLKNLIVVEEDSREGVYHNALHDAIHQTNHLLKILRS
jgi:hypothetical protein